MREILFRGKTESGDWAYGYYVFTPKRTGTFGQTISQADFDRHYILTMKYNFAKEINMGCGKEKKAVRGDGYATKHKTQKS